ncbi:MAG TPA: oligosaccharide flippase family protein [Gemmatimonadales bacterium]|nr:oligosaccharide flippase family protein [Gemmatimonadales bacterium]
MPADTAYAPAPAGPAEGARLERPALTRRASLNAVQSLLDYTAKLVVGLVVTPILVSGLGRSLYGVWEMLGRLIGYISATDARPMEALRLVVATRQGLDDPAGHRRAVGSALVVWLAFVPIVTAVGAVLVGFAPVVTKVAPDLAPVVRLAAALLVAGFLVAGLAAVPESVLRGMNLGYKRMGLQAGLSLAGGGLMTLAVRRGLGLTGVAGSQLVLGALTGACFWLLARRYVPWFGVARPSRPEVRALLRMSGWLAGGELIAKLSLASDVLILGAVVSSSVVTTYVLTGYAARLALGLHFLTVGAAMPGLGGVIGDGQFERAAQLRRELLALTWLFATAGGATILLWNRSFINLWVGPSLYAGFWVNLLTVLVTIQTALVRSDAYVLDAALQPRSRVVVSAVAAVLVLGIGLALAPALGMTGVCLGLLAGRAAQSVAYPALVSASLGGRRRLSLQPLVRPLAASVLILGAAGLAGERVLAPGWIAWGALVAASAVLLLPVTLLAGLGAADRRRVLARAREIWRGVRRG